MTISKLSNVFEILIQMQIDFGQDISINNYLQYMKLDQKMKLILYVQCEFSKM